MATSSTVMNRLSVAAPRLRKSGEAEMTSILIEIEMNRRPISAAAAPPMTTANVSHPGTAAPGVGNRDRHRNRVHASIRLRGTGSIGLVSVRNEPDRCVA
jgi:hypothetical protein